MTALESETVILFNEAEDTCEFYTCSARVNKLLTTRGLSPYKSDILHSAESGWYYHFPKSTILIKPANRIIRIGGRRKVNAVSRNCSPDAQLQNNN